MSDVANTIYRQLGGNRFRVMTGAKNMVSLENGIGMRIGRNKTNANYMEITLNELDLYDITFAKVTKNFELKSVKGYDNVYRYSGGGTGSQRNCTAGRSTATTHIKQAGYFKYFITHTTCNEMQ